MGVSWRIWSKYIVFIINILFLNVKNAFTHLVFFKTPLSFSNFLDTYEIDYVFIDLKIQKNTREHMLEILDLLRLMATDNHSLAEN